MSTQNGRVAYRHQLLYIYSIEITLPLGPGFPSQQTGISFHSACCTHKHIFVKCERIECSESSAYIEEGFGLLCAGAPDVATGKHHPCSYQQPWLAHLHHTEGASKRTLANRQVLLCPWSNQLVPQWHPVCREQSTHFNTSNLYGMELYHSCCTFLPHCYKRPREESSASGLSKQHMLPEVDYAQGKGQIHAEQDHLKHSLFQLCQT